ncbi:MAG: phage/plasmid primase, P4 family [Pirellula sp.]
MRNNFFVSDLYARGIEGHIDALDLPMRILTHDGREAYHCAFELETKSLKVEVDSGKLNEKGKPVYNYVEQSPSHVAPLSFNKYAGIARGTMGYAWFDFDDAESGGVKALEDVKLFYLKCGRPEHFKFYYSGSKGFHVAVPMAYLNLQSSEKLPAILNFVGISLKRQDLKTLDTTVFNAQRKFRALGSKHPKTGLYKISLSVDQVHTMTLEQIKEFATHRGNLEMTEAPFCQPILFISEIASLFAAQQNESLSFKEWAKYKRTSGEKAMSECDFLKHCKEDAAALSEPEWYAAASVVGRFEDGRAKFHAISKPHPDYSVLLTDEKLDQALGSTGPRTCQGIQAIWGKCFNCKYFEKIKSPVTILEKEVIPTEATGFYFVEEIKGKIKRTPDFDGLVRAYKRDKGYFVDSYTDIVYNWTGTHFEITNEIELKAWCETVMVPAPSMRIANEFFQKIKRNFVMTATEIEDLFFKSTVGKLNVQNGILDVAEGIVTPHDPDVGFRYVLPYAFDPLAKCPTFLRFMKDITLGRKELEQTLTEFMAYVLWPGYEHHLLLWLTGTGRNGKSTYLNLIEDLVGKKNTSSVLLAQFDKPNYLQRMDGKLVNLSEESDSTKIAPEILGILKALSSAAGVEVDQKFQVPYTMRPTAKLAFAANKPPYLSGTEDALKSRLIVVPFDLKLEEHGTDGTASKIDWQLREKLKAELPGILNLCLLALRDFVLRIPRKIHCADISYKAMNEIMRDSDPVESWIQDSLDVVPLETAKWVSINEIFLHFKEDSQDEYLTIISFSRRLRQKLGNKIIEDRVMKDGKRQRLIRGVVLRSEALNQPDF